MTGQRTFTVHHLAERLGLTPAEASGAARVARSGAPGCICLRPDPGAQGCLRCGGTTGWAPSLRIRAR